MPGLIPYPTSGKKLPRSWAEGVTDAANAVRQIGAAGMLVREMGPLGSGAEALPGNRRDRRGAARPQPFEVRFDATLSNGSGGWKIYLPSEHLVQYKGEYLDPIGGATAIQDANGDDTAWFEFDEIDLEAEHIWLVVSTDDSGSASGSTASAEFSDEEGEGDGDVSVCIAEVSYEDGDNGAPPTVEIKQSVVGELILGGENDDTALVPDDISVEIAPEPTEEELAGKTDEEIAEMLAESGKLQIKGWNKGLPELGNTIAQILWDAGIGSEANAKVVVRDSSGVLHYVPIGRLDPATSIVAADGPFSPVLDQNDAVTGFANCFYQAGGVTRQMADWNGLPVATGFIALRINANSATPGATLVGFATFAALVAEQANTSYLHVPLYRVADSRITLDMRRMPFMQLAEVF